MNIFSSPPKTEYTVLNLGAGVQSSALALMAAHGEITPMPDFAVFADTGAEPQSVYDWLDVLEKLLPYPIHRVQEGNLTDDSLLVGTISRGPNIGMPKVRRLIPAFGELPNGEKTAAIGRNCTASYKIVPIERKLKELCGIKRGQKNITVTQWIGISWDEIQRAKPSKALWSQIHWPLLEKRIDRMACIKWMIDNGYPIPPRSACVYCPFHSDSEWRRLRDEEPDEFAKAVKFDDDLRTAHRDHNPTMNMTVYLHNSCKPLDQVDFDNDEDKGQQVWDFQAECEGMCGV